MPVLSSQPVQGFIRRSWLQSFDQFVIDGHWGLAPNLCLWSSSQLPGTHWSSVFVMQS